MKNIKKLFLLLILVLFPLGVNAERVNNVNYDIEDMYINANVDILGSIHVEEAIVVKGSLNGFERIINFKNPILEDYEKGKIDFSNSAIYNARAVVLANVSSFKIEKDAIGWDILSGLKTSYKETESANPGETGIYTNEKNENGIKLRVYNPNSSGYVVYYFEYYIDQAVVLHNDVAELYWQFIPTDFDYVKNAHIQVVIPGSCSSDTFRFWAHGPLNGNIRAILGETKDDGTELYRGVLADVEDINGTGTDIRITFDKNFMSMAKEILNESGQDALEEIIKVETVRADSANQTRKLSKIILYGIYILSGLYFIGLIILWIYMYKKYDKEYKIPFDAKYYREFTGDYGVEVVEYLMKKSVTTEGLSASIMNLIYKKNIEVIENEKDKKNPTLKLLNEDNLSDAEKVVIELLFKTVTNKDEVTMKEIEKFSSKRSTAEKFMNKYKYWEEKVKEAGEAEEFFENHTTNKITAALYLLLGIIIIVLMFVFNMVNPIIMALIGISSIAFLIYVMSFKKWTNKGREHYLKWKAFKNFLQDFGSFKEKELPEIKLWEKYLVYATIFGLAKTVQKTMKMKLTEFGYDTNTYYRSSSFYHDYYIGNIVSNSIKNSYTGSLSTISASTANSSLSSGGGFGGGFSSGGGFGGGGGGGHGF